MIVTTGKIIKVDVNGHFRLERSCETPGGVTVTDRDGRSVMLPANEGEAARFIAAYRRVITEDVPYRKSEVESPEPRSLGCTKDIKPGMCDCRACYELRF